MSRQLFVDLDGVLSDFIGHYENLFGVTPDPDSYDPPEFWDNVHKNGTFYLDQPLKSDALDLWKGVQIYHPNPIILSGIPRSVPNVAAQKRLWVDKYLGRHVELICCYSKDKWRNGKFGDILIDDRAKYSKYWVERGGVFILHTSAEASLTALRRLYYPPV